MQALVASGRLYGVLPQLRRSSRAAPAALSSSRPPLRRAGVVAKAKDSKTTGNAALDNALEVGGNLVDSAANLVPDSVPRGVAKGGVAVFGGLIVFWLLQKVVSTILTVALLGGAAWFYFQYGGSSSSGAASGSSGGGSSSPGGDPNDPLAEARKIMDKYKK